MYPEHEKLKGLEGRNHIVSEFLEWLESQGLEICTFEDTKWGPRREPILKSFEQILAEFFEIDTKKLAAEKDAMVAELRRANGLE